MDDGSFETSLAHVVRASPKPVIVVLFVLGAVLIATVRQPYWQPENRCTFLLGCLGLVTAAAVLWLEGRVPLVGRWLAVITLSAIVYFGGRWLRVPELPTLLVIPVALAATLIGMQCGVFAGVGATVLAMAPSPYVASRGIGLATVVAVWGVLGVLYAVYEPLRSGAAWVNDSFCRASDALEEARARRAELEQVLEDLARANLQLTRLHALAQGLRRTAEEARTAKAQFVANVSHELRTPLNMIIGFSEMMLEAPKAYGSVLPAPLLADLEVINRNAEHLSNLVNDVLELSQLDGDQVALTKEYVRLQEVVDDAATAVRPLYESKGLYLDIRLPLDLPRVFCDRTRIQEVLMNLLSNAGRVTESGGAWVQARREDDRLLVSVSDTGPGIASADMDRLFRPFQQLDGSTRRRHAGTGLGLAISKHFIELHDGLIWVDSELGQGATFTFSLPLCAPKLLSSGFSRWMTPGWEFTQRIRPSPAPKPIDRPRLVVLESGRTLQQLLARYLDEVEIVPVHGWDEALEEALRVPTSTLLINDSPVAQVLSRIGSAETLPEGVASIVCSIPGREEASAQLGVSEFLVKPIPRDTLVAALERVGVVSGTALIVDDDPDALQLFGRILASSGYHYHLLLARDGREALSILRERRPDVILLDLIMPVMDGFQLLESRRQDARLRDIPIIIISARDVADQPIVSNWLAVTRGGGLSASQLLAGIRFFTATLSPRIQTTDLAPTATPSGQSACG